MPTHVALLRGINVGRSKRVAMADLREVIAGLGHTNVRTLLNSGNAVFDSSRKLTSTAGATIRDALEAKTGVRSEVTVVTADDLAAIVAENPLVEHISDPSRFLVAFPATAADLARAAVLAEHERLPDQFAVGTRAAYLWCASGVLESPLAKEFGRRLGDRVTTRNWTTVLKLLALTR